jgi:hypothetical protein
MNFNTGSLAEMLGWEPMRLNRAMEILESRSLAELDGSLGSTPYVTAGIALTSEGMLEAER